MRTAPRFWGRPAALAVARDGSLLVADDTGGTIWRISYTGRPLAPQGGFLSQRPGFAPFRYAQRLDPLKSILA